MDSYQNKKPVSPVTSLMLLIPVIKSRKKIFVCTYIIFFFFMRSSILSRPVKMSWLKIMCIVIIRHKKENYVSILHSLNPSGIRKNYHFSKRVRKNYQGNLKIILNSNYYLHFTLHSGLKMKKNNAVNNMRTSKYVLVYLFLKD